jgi:myo-inositol-1(or 4)-monophosphatase
VEVLIKKLIGEQRSNDSVFGEEAGMVEGDSGLRWVIDPIDGTVNYYYQYPGWVVSIAVESEEQGILAGAVYDPVNDDMYDAWSGGQPRLCTPSIPVGPTRR